MSGVVIGLVVLILLIVIGIAIYFSTSEEKTETPVTPPPYTPPAGGDEEEEEPEQQRFSIVNGWIHEGKYQKMFKVKNDGTLMVTGYSKNDQAAKWSFEAVDDKSEYFYIVSSGASPMPGRVLRVTSSVVQLTNSKDATSKIKLNKSGDAYKISDRTGNYFVKIQGSQILTTNKKDEASVFMIEPSQFYITVNKTEETGVSDVEGFAGATTMVLADHSVDCDNGGLTGLSLIKDGDQYRYDFTCMKGIDTSGDVVTKVNPESDARSGNIRALTGQNIDCNDKLIKSSQLLYQNLEGQGQIAYSYSCLPTPLDMTKCENKETSGVNPVGDGNNSLNALTQGNMKMQCPTGKGITNIKLIQDSEGNDVKYQYKCCPPA